MQDGFVWQSRVFMARVGVFAMLAVIWGPTLALAQSSEDRFVQREQRRIQREPGNVGAYVRLADGFIRKARETADAGYLARAEQALRRAVEIAPDHAGAARHLAYALSARHDFPAAVVQAEKAIALDPADADAHGVLGDASLELGRYDRAAAAYEAMMRLKGDLASYSRRSGLKNLMGDPRGAIADLERAVLLGMANGQPRESIAWAEWQLGAEHFAIGEIERAEAKFRAALETYPGYYRALGGLGQVRAAQGRDDEAVRLYREALAVAPVPEYAVALGDIHAKQGRAADARKQYDLVEHIGRLNALGAAIYDRELAYFYADHDLKVDVALELAQREIAVRQDVYGYDLLAWALHKTGRSREALAPMAEALRLGTRDAKLFFHAGMIHRAAGDPERAREYLARALATNPHFHVLHAAVAARALEELATGPTSDAVRAAR